MKRNRKHSRGIIAAAALLALAPISAAGAQEIEAQATAALERMGSLLRGLKVYQVEAHTAREVVLDNGLKVTYSGTANVLARTPDRLRAEVSSDRNDRLYLYDGKEFTLWAKRINYYATVPAPPTIGALAAMAEQELGLEIPLVDLFNWGVSGVSAAGITAAVDLGSSTVNGTTCTHYAFRQEGLDWQIWIQRGDYPLPRKLVLTTTTDEARPQFAATYDWNLAPSFNEGAFRFDPPAGAQRIVFAKLEE